jgi:DNA polymerase (family 10)
MRSKRGDRVIISGKLLNLIKMEDIRGDLHVHSKYSDGSATLEKIALRSKKLGYNYVAVCDHSACARYGKDLGIRRLTERNKEIDRLNAELGGITLLKGLEVNILSNGSLDYPDDILEEFDFVIAGIHRDLRNNVTRRVLSVMDDPNVDVIAHPTGRLFSGMVGHKVDLNKILLRAKETKTALEINASPFRLDLNAIGCRKAKEIGVKLSIGSDAHALWMMRFIELGVRVARRGWLEKKDLLNTYPIEELKRLKRQA